MASVVHVSLGARSYEIRIQPGILEEAGSICRGLGLGLDAFVVSDSNVDLLYGDRVEKSLEGAGFSVQRTVVPAGETAKCPEQLLALYRRAVKAGLARDGFVVALGGGVVGDLAGFFAATYLRGLPYVQIPTSLIAMVDSSVGGKTGINLPAGKNLVGAFHQPSAVITDPTVLKTLPRREFISGIAEVVKYGLIRDRLLFERLEKEVDNLPHPEWAAWSEVIKRCCEIKAEVVSQDERESGLRAILNFGHTLGHALEQATGYARWLHGEAVAMGMVYAAFLSVAKLGFPRADAERIRTLLQQVHLPVVPVDGSWDVLRKSIQVDKKVRHARPQFVLLRSIGEAAYGCEVEEDLMRQTWEECCSWQETSKGVGHVLGE